MPHDKTTPPCAPPTPPCQPPPPSLLLYLSPLLSLSLVPWSHHHTGPPPPTTTVFHTTFRVPVLDHPYSKLWAGGQGRQAQQRRGTRHTTNRMTEPQTRWGTCRETRRRHDTPSDGYRDSPQGPPRARPRPPGGRYASSAGAGEGERPRCGVRGTTPRPPVMDPFAPASGDPLGGGTGR
jgi:hypothetical protein